MCKDLSIFDLWNRRHWWCKTSIFVISIIYRRRSNRVYNLRYRGSQNQTKKKTTIFVLNFHETASLFKNSSKLWSLKQLKLVSTILEENIKQVFDEESWKTCLCIGAVKLWLHLLCWNINALSSSQSESTNRCNFVNSLDWEHFVNEGRLLKSREQFLDACRLVVHLLLWILLQVELLLKLVKLRPELPLIVFNIDSIALESLNLLKLLVFLGFDARKILVQSSQFSFKCFSLIRFFRCLISLQLRGLQLEILL